MGENFRLAGSGGISRAAIREAGPTDAEFNSSDLYQHVLYLEVYSTV